MLRASADCATALLDLPLAPAPIDYQSRWTSSEAVTRQNEAACIRIQWSAVPQPMCSSASAMSADKPAPPFSRRDSVPRLQPRRPAVPVTLQPTFLPGFAAKFAEMRRVHHHVEATPPPPPPTPSRRRT